MSRFSPRIAVVNASTVVDDFDAVKVVAALQHQAREHFAPVWGRSAALSFTARGEQPPADRWWLVIADDSDQAGALGYHDLTSANLPIGKVFAKTDMAYGLQWSVTASHELTEILVDPNLNDGAWFGRGQWWAKEVADAVEADELGYEIDGVLVSDFVTPRWFEPGVPGPYAYRTELSKPGELAPGGYISIWTPSKGWTQRTNWRSWKQRAPGLHAKIAPQNGARRERRTRGRGKWKRSKVETTREETT